MSPDNWKMRFIYKTFEYVTGITFLIVKKNQTGKFDKNSLVLED